MPGGKTGGAVSTLFKMAVGAGVTVGAVWLHSVVQTNLSPYEFIFVVWGLVGVGAVVVELMRRL